MSQNISHDKIVKCNDSQSHNGYDEHDSLKKLVVIQSFEW